MRYARRCAVTGIVPVSRWLQLGIILFTVGVVMYTLETGSWSTSVYYALILAAADLVYTTLYFKKDFKQTYTGFLLAALVTVIILPPHHSFWALIGGSILAQIWGVKGMVKKVVNGLMFIASSMALFAVYNGFLVFSNNEWPSVDAVIGALLAAFAYDATSYLIVAGILRIGYKQKDWKEYTGLYRDGAIYTAGSAALALVTCFLISINPVLFLVLNIFFLFFLRPVYYLPGVQKQIMAR